MRLAKTWLYTNLFVYNQGFYWLVSIKPNQLATIKSNSTQQIIVTKNNDRAFRRNRMNAENPLFHENCINLICRQLKSK